jgi:ubiquinone/menaquinone biosynthesis C-methylase UbiE
LRRARAWWRGRQIVPFDPDEQWFWDHYDSAAAQIVDFYAGAGVSLVGRTVADVGCGDGIMAMGVVDRARPAHLVGFDVNAVDSEALLGRARRFGVAAELPPTLEFRVSEPTRLPADDATFDAVFTWSAFEHVREPLELLRDVRRVLKADGVLMLQLWPFHRSAKGSHLWDWFPDDFHHLEQTEEEIVEQMRSSDRHTPEWTEYMLGEFQKLNRVRVDELKDAIVSAGFDIRRLHFYSEEATLPLGLAARYPLSDLGISGVKLLAVPVRVHGERRGA